MRRRDALMVHPRRHGLFRLQEGARAVGELFDVHGGPCRWFSRHVELPRGNARLGCRGPQRPQRFGNLRGPSVRMASGPCYFGFIGRIVFGSGRIVFGYCVTTSKSVPNGTGIAPGTLLAISVT